MTQTISPATPATFLRWSYIENGRWHDSDEVSAYLGNAWRIGWGVVVALGGGAALAIFHPIVGMIVAALCLYGISLKRYGIWRGACPHCGKEVAFQNGTTAAACPICTRRIFIANNQFEAV